MLRAKRSTPNSYPRIPIRILEDEAIDVKSEVDAADGDDLYEVYVHVSILVFKLTNFKAPKRGSVSSTS